MDSFEAMLAHYKTVIVQLERHVFDLFEFCGRTILHHSHPTSILPMSQSRFLQDNLDPELVAGHCDAALAVHLAHREATGLMTIGHVFVRDVGEE